MCDKDELEFFNDEDGEISVAKDDKLSSVLISLNHSLNTMAKSMMAIEKLSKRPSSGDKRDPAVEDVILEKRQKSNKEDPRDKEEDDDQDSDDEVLRCHNKSADSAGKDKAYALPEQVDLLNEISQDFAHDEDIGPPIKQQLADIINKRWSLKLSVTS